MQEWRGLWLPDGEEHLIEWMQKKNIVVDGKPSYQYEKLQMALGYVKNWRVAVDVGAHCGLISMHLVKKFQCVMAFEPVEAHRECFVKNVGPGAVLAPCALGEKEGTVSIHTSANSSGDSWVDGEGDIPLRRLDFYELDNVDFIKLDCEGYELFALRGGEETLKRCKPCVMVEQKPRRAQKFGLGETDAVYYLKSLGATLKASKSGDYIMAWN